MNRRHHTLLALAALPLALGLAACSNADEDGDAGTFADDGNVPAETVEAALTSFLSDNKITGSIESCEEITDEVDATGTCAATIDGKSGEVPVTVASSTDTETIFDFDLTEFGYEPR